MVCGFEAATADASTGPSQPQAERSILDVSVNLVKPAPAEILGKQYLVFAQRD
jgi:hypothetical protein